MTVDEIFSKLAANMIKGLMIHEQLANYYDFLGLKGYKRIHEYYYLDETCNYRKLCRYYINHFNKLIKEDEIENPDIIPTSWFDHIREDVDISTRKNAVKNGITAWVTWERETKKLYEKLYRELMALDEVSAALYISCFIEDVDYELKKAERCHIYRKATDYDITLIEQDQQAMHDKYKEKLKCVIEKLC